MSITIVAETALERNTLSAIQHHPPGAPRFYALPEGVDCTVRCACGYEALGFARSHIEAETFALADHRAHLQTVYEHARRCPQDVEVLA